jgi:hypothetical protein
MKGVPFTAEVEVPQVPNFLRSTLAPLGASIPVDALTEEELRRVGEAWTEALIVNARKMRASRGPTP